MSALGSPAARPKMSLTRFVRLGIRFAAWATPHVQAWHRSRSLNLSEGRRHLAAGNWPQAERYLNAALSERKHSPKEHFYLLLDLAEAEQGQNRLKEAEATVLEAHDLAVRQRSHAMHLAALDMLVELQIEQGKYDDAQTTAEKIERLENAQSNPDAARLARAARKLGTALARSQQHEGDLAAYERAVQLSEKAFGAEHAETGNTIAELGLLHRERGNHIDAQRHLRRALQIHRAVSGADSHEATRTAYHLAGSLSESGDMYGAAHEYERLLNLRERQIGADPEETADAQLRLAQLYLRMGRVSAARELLRQAVNVLEVKRSQRLPEALASLADADERAGRIEDANRLRVMAANISAKQRSDSPAAPQIR